MAKLVAMEAEEDIVEKEDVVEEVLTHTVLILLLLNMIFFNKKQKFSSANEWTALTPHQKCMIQDLKGRDGWINSQTPPLECVID